MPWLEKEIKTSKKLIRLNLYACTLNMLFTVLLVLGSSMLAYVNLLFMLVSFTVAVKAYKILGKEAQLLVDYKSHTKAWELLVEYEKRKQK